LAGKNVSKITYSVRVRCKTLTQSINLEVVKFLTMSFFSIMPSSSTVRYFVPSCMHVVTRWCCIVDKVTEGVDRTDADADVTESTDTGDNTSQATQSNQPKTHEKADMAVISAAYPGEQLYQEHMMCIVTLLQCW